MTQEEKQLLLADFSARLPYGVVVNYNGLARPLFNISPTQHFQITLDNALDSEHNGLVYVSLDADGEKPKPYLRPMSSMTEKEKEELLNLLFDKEAKYFYINGEGLIDGKTSSLMKEGLNYPAFCPINITLYTDWLNEHHLDFRNLIGRGLAIDCTDLNIY